MSDDIEAKTRLCSKCGETKDLTAEFWFTGDKRDGFLFVCKACRSALSKERYYNDHHKHIEKKRLYRESNIDKVRESNNLTYKRRRSLFPEKIKESKRKSSQKLVASLGDGYIKRKICRMGVNLGSITPEMIEEKRQMIQWHRTIKSIKREALNPDGHQETGNPSIDPKARTLEAR